MRYLLILSAFLFLSLASPVTLANDPKQMGLGIAEQALEVAKDAMKTEVEKMATDEEAETLTYPDTILSGEVPEEVVTKGKFCEGTYTCSQDGTTYKAGETTRIGFWNVETCPGATTLADGSKWTYKAFSCSCP